MSEVHKDQGHGQDSKYSLWRRINFPKLTNLRNCYTTDIDWLEWRNGKPIAIIECRRVIGGLSDCNAVVTHFKTLNNGFQLEAYARLAYELKIKAFVVAINDKNPEVSDYSDSEFLITEIIPPETWPEGRLNINEIKLQEIGLFNEEKYAEFISRLGK
jgi:hypothetical protein